MITRGQVRATRATHVYVFGDNVLERGRGGQAAVCRGEPNCVGVPTKIAPSRRPDAYFTDDHYDENCALIARALDRIRARAAGRTVVVLPGIGEGLAELPQRAPRTYEFLRRVLAEWTSP